MTTDPESTTLLQQAEALARAEGNRLGVSVTTDGQQVDGTLKLSATWGERAWAWAWATVRGQKEQRPQVSAGVAVGVRWLTPQPDEAYWARVEQVADLIESDGCTLVSQWHQPCCHAHDIMYRTGRTVEGAPVSRRDADAMFRRCILARETSRLGRLRAWVRWAGVRVLGVGRYRVTDRVDWPT